MKCTYCGQQHDLNGRCENGTRSDYWTSEALPMWLALSRTRGSSEAEQ